MKKSWIIIITLCVIFGIWGLRHKQPSTLPLIAVANYGPHASLEAAIQGMKQELAAQGFIENKTVQYDIQHVGFDPALIPQMVNQLASEHPKVLVVVGTPVAQFAKGAVKDIPLVYTVVTDPVEAGLLKNEHQASANMTGSSDRQDLLVFLQFAKKLLPKAQRVGLLYSTSEANDAALLRMMKQAASAEGMSVVAVPIAQARDVPFAMPQFRDKVDLIYVGASGPIQPTLPVVASMANQMHVPVFNVDANAVKDHLVLASFGVDYTQVGVNTGQLVAEVLAGKPIQSLPPIFPNTQAYHGVLSRSKANELGIVIPENLSQVTIVE
ncbi:MAG: ABC transporter substrate-binding protein [Gammaproteobacteria bacterium]|nr:ABC transporter substrate-binding protein [Gammaproteobacteria bacterium]